MQIVINSLNHLQSPMNPESHRHLFPPALRAIPRGAATLGDPEAAEEALLRERRKAAEQNNKAAKVSRLPMEEVPMEEVEEVL